MKIVTAYLILFIVSFTTAISQVPTITNSYEAIYNKTNPTLHYRYDSINQIHNYSENWDFDADGKTDQLFFVGTGGAHLYYYLRIVLSSDKVIQDFPFITTDSPLLPDRKLLKNGNYNPSKTPIQFAVIDSDKNGNNDIFIHLDSQTMISDILKQNGVTSKVILIYYKNGKFYFTNYKA